MGNPNAGPNGIKTQWKSGQSGNPLGRPKGSRNLTTNLKEFLDLEIITADPITGDKVTCPVRSLVNAQLIKSAINGDVKAIREIFDRIEGKPKQKLDVTADKKISDFLNSCMQKAVGGGQ